MKKRLLITSIVMMLVVAVALSTATYAWFTSNASVTASSITLNAANNDGAALGISWLNGTVGTSISANAPAAALKPMVPSALNMASGSETTAAAIAWSGASIRTDAGLQKFNTPYAGISAYTYNGTVGSTTNESVIVLTNLSASNAIQHVVLTPTIAAVQNSTHEDASALVRIAVFKSASSTGDFKLCAVLGSAQGSNNTAVGTVALDAEITTVTASASTTANIDLGQISANSSIYLKVMMWLDGILLVDDKASADATVVMNFAASATV